MATTTRTKKSGYAFSRNSLHLNNSSVTFKLSTYSDGTVSLDISSESITYASEANCSWEEGTTSTHFNITNTYCFTVEQVKELRYALTEYLTPQLTVNDLVRNAEESEGVSA